MATEKAWIIGPENVCDWYNKMARDDTPYYSVWSGKTLRFSYDGDDKSAGEELLLLNLDMVRELKSSQVLTLKLHNDLFKGTINDKTHYNASIDFRCVPAEDDALAFSALSYSSAHGEIGRLKDEIKDLKNASQSGIMGYLGPMLENPDVQNMIAGTVIGFLGKLLPGIMPGSAPMMASPAAPQGAAMGSIGDPTEDEAAKLNRDLERLGAQDPDIIEDLGKLADLAEKKPDIFKMVLAQLRNM